MFNINAEIEIEVYNPQWKLKYEQERSNILNAANLYIKDIQHIGSTAVPGLAAKPTIDICIGVVSLEIADKYIIPLLKAKGYDYLQFLEKVIPSRRYLQKLNQAGKHIFHIHIVEINRELWNNYLKFRNYLLNNPVENKNYEQLKIELKNKFYNNREKYTLGKSHYISQILLKVSN